MKLELASVEQLNLGLSAGAVAASFAFATPHFAGSLAAGAFLEAINFGTIHRAARQIFSGEEMLGRARLGFFSLRFMILAVAIFVTLQAGADPIALVIGLSITMPAALIDAWINRPPVLDPESLPAFVGDRYEGETDDDVEYWENYSIWRPGRLLTFERDDLLTEDATRQAEEDEAFEEKQYEMALAADARSAQDERKS